MHSKGDDTLPKLVMLSNSIIESRCGKNFKALNFVQVRNGAACASLVLARLGLNVHSAGFADSPAGPPRKERTHCCVQGTPELCFAS